MQRSKTQRSNPQWALLAPALTALTLTSTAALSSAAAQTAPGRAHVQRAWCSNVILPQARAFHVDHSAPAVRVAGIRAGILVVDGVATTTLDVRVENMSANASEAELLLLARRPGS